MSDNIKFLRLVSGEDIICDMDENTDNYTVYNAMTVMINNMSGKEVLRINHWLPIPIVAENVTNIPKSQVVSVFEPSVEFRQYYIDLINEFESKMKENELFKDGSKDVMESYMDILDNMNNTVIH